MNRAGVVGTLIALTLILGGCAGESGITTAGSPDDIETEVVEPSGMFSSPWAELFDYSYSIAKSDLERNALQDERVDDQEYAFFRSRIIDCLAGLGVKASFDKDNSLSYDLPDDVRSDQVTKCMQENGLHILTLRESMDRNPQNLDENIIMVDCLRRAGVVDEAYTPDDYANGASADKIVLDPGFDRCNADPLGFKGGK